MAVTNEQKIDFLLKKIGYTKTKTGSVVGTGAISGTPKQPFAEAIPSPLIIANGALWNEADSIPATPPGADTTQVKVYLAATSGLRMTADATSSGQRAYIAYSTYGNTSSTRLTNWIDTQFGASYIIKVYKGDPNSGGVALSAAGSGSNDGWFFDYSAGVLNFNDTSVPSGVTDTNIYIVGYRYIGQTGAPTSGISTFSYLDLTVERNLDVGIQGGISTFRNNIDLNANLDVSGSSTFTGAITANGAIDLNADLDVDGHTNLDNVSVAGVTTFSNNVRLLERDRLQLGNSQEFQIYYGLRDYNNTDDHAVIRNSTGNLYIQEDSHIVFETPAGSDMASMSAGDAVKLFFNGTQKFQTTNTGINVTGNVVGDGLTIDGDSDLNGDLDVDGHTNLDNVSIAGFTTITQDLDVDGHTNLDNISVAGVSTFTGDATFSGNVSIGGTLTYEDVTNIDSVGLLTARSGIRVTGGVIEAQAGENKIPSLYSNLGALPSAGTYHGMFAHVHSTGRGYFAHAGNWLELVNVETNGVVGTGTQRYNLGALVSTSTTATSLNVTGVTTAVTLDVNGDLDVDGHTNLDNVSIAGLTTMSDDLKVDGNIRVQASSGYGFVKVFDGNPSGGGSLIVGDNNDLFIYHGGHNYYDGRNNARHIFMFNGSEVACSMIPNNKVSLYYDNVAKFETATSGVKIVGTTTSTQLAITGVSTFTGAIDANGDLDVDGHTNLDNVSVAGVTTFGGNAKVNGDLTIESVSPNIYLTDTNHNSDFKINVNNGLFSVRDETNGANRFTVASDGTTTVAQNLDVGAGIDVTGNATVTGDIDVDGHTNLDNVNVAGVSTFAGNVNINADLDVDGHTNLDNVNIVGVTTAAGHILPATDSTYDLGSSSKYWRHVYADNVTGGGGGVTIGDDIITRNLKVNGISTFTGNIDANGDLDVDGHTNLDNVSIAGVTTFAANARFNSTITAGGATGTNGQYLKTTGTGVEWATFPTMRTRQTSTASAGQTTFSFTYTVNFLDVFVNGIKLTDAEFTATNGSSVVLAVGCFVGDIVELVSYNTVSGGGGGGGGSLNNIVEDTTPQLGGNLDLFSKTITGTGGINMTGVVTATSFVGNGSGLTGVVASGSGVVVKNSGSTVGTAGTIDFGTNLSVTPASAGIVTITAGVTTSQFDVNKLHVSGITTFVGITTFTNEVSFRPPLYGKVNFYGSVEGQRLRWQNNGSNVGLYFNDGVVSYYGSDSRTQISPHGNGGASDHFRIWQYRPDGKDNKMLISSDFITISGAQYGSHSSRTIAKINYDDGASFYHFGNKKLQTSGIGITVTGTVVATGADINGDIDVDGHTELDNVNIAGVVTATTFKGALQGTSGTFSSGVDITGDLDVDGHTDLDNVSVAGVSTFSGNLHVGTGATVGIGSTAYVHKIAFDEAGSTNSTLTAALGSDGSNLTFTGGGVQNGYWGNAGLKIAGNGSSALTGPESGCSLHVVSTDNTKVLFHGAANAQMELRSTTGNGVENIFRSNKALDFVTGTGAYSNVFRVGETEGSTFFHTLNFRASDGGAATATIDAISGIGTFGNIVVGTDGSVSVGTGVTIESNGQATYTGIVTAQKFVGDGSGLTGVTASGSGVVVKHDGSTVGTAGTINFSTNLDVSAISAGIVTITASGGSSNVTSDAQGNTVGGTNSGDSFSGTSAIKNTLFGYNSGTAITSGDQNTSFGYDALRTMTTTESNTAVGFEALRVATGDLGAAFGSGALRSDNGNGYNCAFGANSGYSVTSGSDNSFLGYTAGNNLETGNYNICLGAWSRTSSSSVSRECTIGGNQSSRTTQSFRIPGIGLTVTNTSNTIPSSGSQLSLTGNANFVGVVTATAFHGDGSNLTGISGGGTNVGITTNLSGSFTASAGTAATINTLTGYSANDLVVEYTIYIKNGSNFQSQKLLAMRDGTTIHSTQFAVMYSSSLLVQCDATISSGNILLRATPETGVSGSTTYKVKREVM